MKKKEIEQTYNIEKWSYIEIFKESMKKISDNKQSLIPVYVAYLVYFIIQSYITVQINDKLALVFNILLLFIGLFVSAYLVFTAKEPDTKSMNKERVNTAMSTIKGQLKTVLAGFLICLPAIIICIAIGLFFVLLSPYSDQSAEYAKNMQSYYYIGVIFILIFMALLTSIYYATYITIYHGLTGISAVRFSMMIFKKNKIGSLVLFFVLSLIPILVSLVQEEIFPELNILIGYQVFNSFVSFCSFFFITTLLEKTVSVKFNGKI